MSLIETRVFEDTETGEVIDIISDDYDDDDDDDGLRNAPRTRNPRGRGRRPRPWRRTPKWRPRRYPPYQPPVYTGGRDTVIVRRKEDDHISLRKSALVELLPSAGKVLASFLSLPAAPRAIGDDVVDRDNAAEHREVIAKQSQTERRIMAITELAAKAVKLFAD